jgi:hypothetical protein
LLNHHRSIMFQRFPILFLWYLHFSLLNHHRSSWVIWKPIPRRPQRQRRRLAAFRRARANLELVSLEKITSIGYHENYMYLCDVLNVLCPRLMHTCIYRERERYLHWWSLVYLYFFECLFVCIYICMYLCIYVYVYIILYICCCIYMYICI